MYNNSKDYVSTQTVTYPLIVEDIKQIMDHLGVQKAFICSYSTGGSIALEFLLTAPERALGGIFVGGIFVGGISQVMDWRLKKITLHRDYVV
jgi:pimeloyl-ACP methyl ester carboxylesterase